MLFSNSNIAKFVSDQFEPVWQSVRPVPVVTIDFGNGKKVQRTLHGNIATYICTPKGHVIDVLPGLYTPRVFADRVIALMLESTKAPKTHAEFGKWLASRHEERIKKAEEEKAKKSGNARRPVLRDPTKVITIERSVVLALSTPPAVQKTPPDVVKALGSPDQETIWKALVEDTRINDTVRREKISRFLMTAGPIPPSAMTRWLYREVLDADIDDPWLGLKDLSDASVFSSVEARSPQTVATQK